MRSAVPDQRDFANAHCATRSGTRCNRLSQLSRWLARTAVRYLGTVKPRARQYMDREKQGLSAQAADQFGGALDRSTGSQVTRQREYARRVCKRQRARVGRDIEAAAYSVLRVV